MEIAINAEPQQDVDVSITFSELQCLDCEDISTCVSKQNALKICKSSLVDLSAKTGDVLSLWLRKLLRAYSTTDEFCMEVFKCLYEWCLQLKNDVTAGTKEASDNYITLLADALSFAEWAKQNLLSNNAYRLAAIFLLGIVYSCLQLINEHNIKPLKEHEPKAIDLHLMALSLLEKILPTSTTIHPQISPLVRQLVDIADFLSPNMRYLHVLMKTSKTITKLCTHFAQFVKIATDNLAIADLQEETTMHLCDTILTQLETLHRDDTQTVPMDKVEEFLKVTQVYLILLHKVLSCDLKGIDEVLLKDIVHVLNMGETKPNCDLGKNLPKLLAKYVRPYTLHIFELIYQHEDFQKYLNHLLDKKLDVDLSELGLGFITAIITDDTEISQPTAQTVQKIFEFLFKDAYIFTSANRYNQFLEAFATLLHVTCFASLINYFITGLFQEDIIKSQVCADILMLFFRLEETNHSWNKNNIEQATRYWIKCNNSYAMFSNNLSQLHVQRMLKYFHKLGSHEMPIFNIRNYRYLHCVSSRTEHQRRPLLLRLQRSMEAPLTNIEQYYEMISIMELLSPSEDAEFLTRVWKQFKDMAPCNKCKILDKIFFKLALQFASFEKLTILQKAIEVPDSCWYAQKFFHACKSSDNAQLKSLAEQHGINTELQALLDAVQPVIIHQATSNTLKHINYKLNYRKYQNHYCNLNTSLKRKRSHIELEPKKLIQQIDLNVQQLLQCSAHLDSSDNLQLESIVQKLKHIRSDV